MHLLILRLQSLSTVILEPKKMKSVTVSSFSLSICYDLEPNILECEVKWVLESITMNKASGGDGIPVELFQIAALNMPANLENSEVATGLEKISFHSNPKERQCQRMLKLLHNCTHLTH